MTLPPDCALRAGKSLVAKIGDECVVQFLIIERETGTQRGEIETGAFRMRDMFRVDRGDRALPQRLPPSGVGHDRTVDECFVFVGETLDCTRDRFFVKVGFQEK